MDKTIRSAESIEVVIKVAERCNINCSYCYVFNKGNTAYLQKPVKISRDMMVATTNYVVDGAKALGSTTVAVVFHGGEPLMMGKRDFDFFCKTLHEALDSVTDLRLNLQTNAMLIDDEWIDLFAKHSISVGVSIDGPKHVHDAERKDFRNRGTYDRTLVGLRSLQVAAREGKIPWPGIICVINATANGSEVYRHFIDDLGVKSMTLHLPMDTHETFRGQDPMPYAQFVCDAFDEWLKDADPEVDVRMFGQMLGFFQGRVVSTTDNPSHLSLQHVTIESDGAIDVDELKPTRFIGESFNVKTSSMIEFANSTTSRYIRDVYASLADECMPCVWRNYCRGGLQHGVQVNRWSDARGFNNVSVLCDGLQKIYSHVAHHMLRAGFSEDGILKVMDHGNRQFNPASAVNLLVDGSGNLHATA